MAADKPRKPTSARATQAGIGKTQSDETTDRIVGPFRLGKQIGLGGMGIVYEAVYLKNGAKVAIKMLSPQMSGDEKLLKRFEREMSILKKLRHPNIVRYYGGGTTGSGSQTQHYYAMELVRGGTLEDELKQKKRLAWERVIDVAQQICRALEHAHTLGIIHRDLKPANLFSGPDGQLKLGDFGIARDTQDVALTQAGRTVGTYNYMAPEQILGKPPVSRKTDLYALGCVLYELLTGRPPFSADNQADLFMKHINDDPEPLANYNVDAPVWLERLIMRLLSKNPDDRPFDALATYQAFEEVKNRVAEGEGVASATAAGLPSVLRSDDDNKAVAKTLKKKKKKKKKPVDEPIWERSWFLGLMLLLIVAGITWVLWPRSEAELGAGIKAALASDELSVWREARDDYGDEYLERFPEGEFAPDAEELIARIVVENKRVWLAKALERDLPAKNDAEKAYLEASRYERLGDREEARTRFQALVTLFDDESDEDVQAVVRLAKEKVTSLEIGSGDDALAKIKEQLDKADELYRSGEPKKAKAIWESVVSLYSSKPDYAELVQQAKDRLGSDE